MIFLLFANLMSFCVEEKLETRQRWQKRLISRYTVLITGQSAMQDLNDLRFFAGVVEQNGFAAAARKLGMPRSRLSRRIGLLEERLGVRLIQRSTRRFGVTEIGREYYR